MLNFTDLFEDNLIIDVSLLGHILTLTILGDEKEEIFYTRCEQKDWDNLARFARHIVAKDKQLKNKILRNEE